MYQLTFVVALLISAACGGGKPQAPRTHVPEHATELNPTVPTGTAEVHLTCNGLSSTPCQQPDYELDVVASALDYCRMNSNGDVSLAIDLASNPGQGLSMEFHGYHGPDTYALSGDNRVSVTSTTVNPRHDVQPPSGEPCGAPGLSTAVAESIGACNGCQVQVFDAHPADPLPKPIGFDITCPTLCHSDTQLCTAAGGGNIRMNVRVQCSAQ